MDDSPRLIHVYLVMTTQGPDRRYVEVEAPDIETAALLGDGIVVLQKAAVDGHRHDRRGDRLAGSTGDWALARSGAVRLEGVERGGSGGASTLRAV